MPASGSSERSLSRWSRAMRVVVNRALTQASGILTGMDGFAPLGGTLAAGPTIGGFRIVRSKPTQNARMRVRRLRRMTGTRLHASGSLSALLVGALTLAVLAGPASCPCDPKTGGGALLAATSDAKTLSRFAYTRASQIDLPSETATPLDLDAAATDADGALPKLAALVEPYEPAYAGGVSPISTAAITPADDARNSFTGRVSLGAFLPERETLTDAAPKLIRLAAAGPADDLIIPTLPMVEIATPDTSEATATEAEPEAESHAHTAHKRALSKRRSRSAQRARKARTRVDPAIAAAQKYRRAPRWAKQMFDNPWQSSAFSYIQ